MHTAHFQAELADDHPDDDFDEGAAYSGDGGYTSDEPDDGMSPEERGEWQISAHPALRADGSANDHGDPGGQGEAEGHQAPNIRCRDPGLAVALLV